MYFWPDHTAYMELLGEVVVDFMMVVRTIQVFNLGMNIANLPPNKIKQVGCLQQLWNNDISTFWRIEHIFYEDQIWKFLRPEQLILN